jgi:molybdopterin converting factor subunit 1
LELPPADEHVYDAIAHMTVTVLLFASYAEALGASSLAVEVPGDATVADVILSVRALPGADRLPAAPLVAVNQQYADVYALVRDGDEVALIPPVAGG